MTETQVTVAVNRGEDRSLSVETDTLEVSSSFDLVLTGHRTPAHVHCRLDETLDAVASLEETNQYVEADDRTVVPVTLEAVDESVTGELEVTTAYGEETETITVTVTPDPSPVAVDERLASPVTRSGHRLVGSDTLTVLGTAAVVIAAAGITAAVIGGPLGVIGFIIVAAGVLVGLGVYYAPSD